MSKIIVQASSPSQLFFILPYLNYHYENISLIWMGRIDILDQIKNLIQLPEHITYFSFDFLPFWRPSIKEKIKYEKFLKENFSLDITEKYKLFIPFNTSIHTQITKKVLHINANNIFLYDDGMAGFLKSKTNFSILKTCFVVLHGYPYVVGSNRLFSDTSLQNGVSINPELLYLGKNKQIKLIDSSSYVRDYLVDLYNRYIKGTFKKDSALILTHHSIESQRMSQEKYFDMIKKVIKEIKASGINNIYFTMHHSEDRKTKFNMYCDLGLLPIKNQSLPAEVLCCSNNLKTLAQPFNSVVFIAGSLGLLKNKRIISYHLENQDSIHQRVEKIISLTKQKRIDHTILDLQ